MNEPLPEYGKPPVTEVAASIQFSPLQNWKGPYAGVYWAEIKNDYPKIQSASPLPYVSENFEELNFQIVPQIQLFDPNVQRIWFLSDDETRLIQIQKDKFIVNWRKITGNEVYPRYNNELRPRFITELARFRKFVFDNRLGEIETIQCELTYVNDIIQGEGWNSFNDAMMLFSNWVSNGSIGFLPALETLRMNGSFPMPSGKGRLYFFMQHVMRQIDMKQAVQLRLVARGIPDTSSDDDIIKWMDLAREWIVRGFTDLTSKSAHDLWDRKR